MVEHIDNDERMKVWSVMGEIYTGKFLKINLSIMGAQTSASLWSYGEGLEKLHDCASTPSLIFAVGFIS